MTAGAMARFGAKTCPEPNSGCLLWTGAVNAEGYGVFNLDPGESAKLAHRVAFFQEHGRWPEPNALHDCDTPPCVEPSHLFEGDQHANMKDAAAKGRCSSQRVTHCPQGHEYTPENTYTRPSRPGRERQCRTCMGQLLGTRPRRWWCKLTDGQVSEMRQRLAMGESGASVARAFDVSQSLVSNIRRGIARTRGQS